ncbi:MAG: hypothetical protein ACREQ3_12135 [Candidatus Binatia bacterium]
MRKIFPPTGVLILVAWSLATALAPLPPMSGAEFFPLTLHSSWTHRVIFSGGDYLYYMTETVVKDDHPLLEEKRSYVVVEDYEPLTKKAPRANSTVAYFRKNGFLHRYPWLTSEGNKIWDTKMGTGTEQILPSPYVGDVTWENNPQTSAWAVDVKQSNTGSAKAWIDPVAVEVPVGIFRNCLRVETVMISRVAGANKVANFRLHFTEWYAKGVGLIKAISSEGEGTPVKSVTELVWYNVQK